MTREKLLEMLFALRPCNLRTSNFHARGAVKPMYPENAAELLDQLKETMLIPNSLLL